MSLAMAIGALTGLGCIGFLRSLRSEPQTLEAIAAAVDRRPQLEHVKQGSRRRSIRSGGLALVGLVDRSRLTGDRWRALGPSFAVAGTSPEAVASRMLVMGGAGLLAPPLLWLMLQMAGASVPIGIAIVIALFAAPLGLVAPILELVNQARARQRHVRIVVASFVDLVVLNLAGGMGVESALMSAARVSPDWAAQRISVSLMRARQGGQASWVALSQLGEGLGVPELVELAATLQLAGTEGSRVRQSLSARAAALRRHEQADTESSANRTTERLFLPGSLLLIGFLLFVGYPAFSRITGGF